jgi:plastocyanin
MKRCCVALMSLVVLALPACGGGSSNAGGATRTILTDYNYDQFATSYLGFFPTVARVHPGDTIDFKQAWTGEPHTVTMGTLADNLGKFMGPYVKKTRPVPGEGDTSLDQEFEAAYKGLPEFFGDDDALHQEAAQPCYLATGDVPDRKPCPQVSQPAFNGRQVFYNSGFIRYEGNNGNHFKVRLADDLAPGEHFFFCLIHGPLMGGFLQVKAKGEAVDSQSALSQQARKDLAPVTARIKKLDKAASEHKDVPAGVDIVEGGNGYEDGGIPPFFVDEFYPSAFRAKVGQKVTWRVSGHTVSFKVPKYGPQIIIGDDGTVKFNPKAYKAQGGPGYPDQPPGGQSEQSGGEPPPVNVDAGNYDGSRFLSSGVPSGTMLYSITFTKPGTYQYACLIHPRMVGKVTVSR